MQCPLPLWGCHESPLGSRLVTDPIPDLQAVIVASVGLPRVPSHLGLRLIRSDCCIAGSVRCLCGSQESHLGSQFVTNPVAQLHVSPLPLRGSHEANLSSRFVTNLMTESHAVSAAFVGFHESGLQQRSY